MTDKNPYENQDQIDIPDFSSIKPKEEDIDRSIFKMNDEPEQNDVEEEEDEEYYEEESSFTPRKSTIVVCAVIMVILLVLAIFGIVWGMGKNNAYKSLQSEYETYKTTATTQINELNTKVTELQAQIDAANTTPATASGDTYKVVVDEINVRSGASASNAKVSYSEIPSDIKDAFSDDGEGNAVVKRNATLKVLEIVKDTDSDIDDDRMWGKLADNVYVLVINYGEEWASKQ